MWRWSRLLLILLGTWGWPAVAADLKLAQQQLQSGQYGECVKLARQALAEHEDTEEWSLVLCDALMAIGRYPEAQTAITNALVKEPWTIRLRWQGREVFLSNGQTNAANETVDEIVRRVSSHPRDFRDARSLVVFGQAALLAGADPKRVLDTLFATAKKTDPKLRDVYLASGQLALDKHDFALAAKTFEEGLKQLPEDPDLNYGLAQAYAPSDAALTQASLQAALERNSNHIGCLLLLVDHHIDAEDYAKADKLLDRIQAVNPWQPKAWAYRAVLAHLRNQREAETSARETALKYWATCPQVDYWIGLKLSQNYRFTEGAAHQRQALRFDADFLPAKAQLAQDLLRLGEEAEGWRLAETVQKQDGYDVSAYNLATLHDTIDKFASITNQHFLVRMSGHEAAVYGTRVLDLLERARSKLCAKYNLDLVAPTIVEIFPEQKDFAVRTFGMPGNPGYLGVCFGNVITANSPAANAGHKSNWEAMLWHEFCHVVTLHLTRNKMPRWLSEGISVYEEGQANPAWGQRMIPRYREMVLGDELTPISKLSGAFLAPPSPVHLQFAYYESALAVEFIVQRFGLDRLKAILCDLGEGVEVNKAIEKHTAPLANLDTDFTAFARNRARQLAPGLDWEKPELASPGSDKSPTAGSASRSGSTSILFRRGANDEQWQAWAKDRPTNFWVMTRQAQEFAEEKQWTEAKAVLERLVEQYPDSTGQESAYRLLASAHRALGETNSERQVLTVFALKDDEAGDAYLRLMDLASAARDWPAVYQNANRYLAVDPLVAPPYRFLAQAAEQIGQTNAAIAAYRSWLQLEPADPAEVHFLLARLLHQAGDPGAKREVLSALEEAPRYRDALRLLLDINRASAPTPAGASAAAGQGTL